MNESLAAVAVPKHVGIIPDGNRRWARERGLPTLEGHRRGLDVAKEIALASFDRGVECFTMYAFSTENWSRTKEEVGYLMELFYSFVGHEFRELEERKVRFQFLGSRDGLPSKLMKAIDDTERRTAGYTAGTVGWCLNYGGQLELADAFKAMLAAGITPDEVTPERISEYIYGTNVPPVDLIIRTSGEHRVSGFMLWRAAYAELYFVQKNWPDFSVEDFDTALTDYARRQRRFGA